VVEDYVEAGASATDDRRPSFQKMMEDAASKPWPFDVIVVHSYSRFYRDAVEAGVHLKRLKRLGIRLVSVTQPTAEDATGEMIRQILLAFDGYQSKENAKHTLRAMKQNAREGYWNGAPPPYGYRVEEAERRGDKIKKRLAIDEVEAAVVREVFELCRNGRAGIPLGVKAIAADLNGRGIRFRDGRRFSTSLVHRILTNPVYGGTYTFNRVSAETGEAKPEDETVSYPCPVIVSPETLAQVAEQLAARAPAQTPPRVVSGPILLTGLAVCSTCGGGMGLRTGTSKTGKVHRYYACSAAARQGRTACRGRSIRMSELDEAVEGGLLEQVFRPDRLAELVAAATSPDVDAGGREREARRLREAQAAAEAALKRLYDAVEAGALDPSEPTLRSRLAELRAQRDKLAGELQSLERRARAAKTSVPDATALARLASRMRDKIQTAEPALRRELIRMFVGTVEVRDEEIVIAGPTGALIDAARDRPDETGGDPGGVRTFVRKWRPLGDGTTIGGPCRISSCSAFSAALQETTATV
jgi:DNA invertase Pin-like site-specific DNA recombinase